MGIETLLNQQVTINRKTVSYSDAGDPGTTWEQVAAQVPCAIEAKAHGFHQGPGGRTVRDKYRAFFGIGTNIQVEDQVVVGSETFLVSHVMDAAGRGSHLEVALVKPAAE